MSFTPRDKMNKIKMIISVSASESITSADKVLLNYKVNLVARTG